MKFVRISCWRAVVQGHGDFDVKRIGLLPFLNCWSRDQLQSATRCGCSSPAEGYAWSHVGGVRGDLSGILHSVASKNAVLSNRGAMLAKRVYSCNLGRAWNHRHATKFAMHAAAWPMHRNPPRTTAATCSADRERSTRTRPEPKENGQLNPKSRRT